MLITCLRHATAEPRDLLATDGERALIKKGTQQVQRVVDFCRKNALTPAGLYSSPLRRAQQTAWLLQAGLTGCPPVERVDWLGLGTPIRKMVDELKALELAGLRDVWLVGHEPDLSLLIGELLQASDSCFVIKKASLTRVEIDFSAEQRGRLLWSLPCALMR